MQPKVNPDHRVAFEVKPTGAWFEGTYVSEGEHHVTFITDEGVTKELRKAMLIHNSHPNEIIFDHTLTG